MDGVLQAMLTNALSRKGEGDEMAKKFKKKYTVLKFYLRREGDSLLIILDKEYF